MRYAVPALLFALGTPSTAAAQSGYAHPPDADRDRTYADPPDRYADPPDGHGLASSFRLAVGPAVRLAEHGLDGGLSAAVDIGSRAAGGRLQASWIRAGSDRGLSEYAAQLFIDFGAERRLHPIVSAGAGAARLDTVSADGGIATSTVGIGVLRGALEYELPIREADARAGIDAEGALPAIRSASAPDTKGWLMFGAHVTVGF
jgi:hypothetical protein